MHIICQLQKTKDKEGREEGRQNKTKQDTLPIKEQG